MHFQSSQQNPKANAPMEEDDAEETLESLLEASCSPEGRLRLAAGGTVASVLSQLSPSSPLHLLKLRLLRNLCAGEPTNQDAFIRSDGPDRVATVILSSSPEIVRAGLQVLGNAALAGEDHRAEVWSRLFPAGFLKFARIRDRGVCDAFCMVLDTCCSSEGGRRRLRELCEDGKGLAIIIEIISTASSVGYQEEWLEWLLSKVCIEEQYFSILFIKLQFLGDLDSHGGDEDPLSLFTGEQAFILRVLSNCLNERPEEVIVSGGFASDILRILREASFAVDFSYRGTSALPTGSSAVDVVGYALTILRDVCAWDGPSSASKVYTDLFSSADLLQLLLGFLSELEPPSSIRKSMENERNQMPAMTDKLKVCPYKGFRRDVVSVISNLLHQRRQVQDEIRRQKGILVLLQQCVIDEDNPFLREWGLMAVRNLLEGNVENQHEIAQLEMQGTVDTPEIAELGLRVEVDKITRRAKLVNI